MSTPKRTPDAARTEWSRKDLLAIQDLSADELNVILDTAMLPHGVNFADGEFQVASLDHAMWFHRPFQADEWLLYHQRSQSASHARGIAEGWIFTRDGRLVVTVMQEGLMRPNVAG